MRRLRLSTFLISLNLGLLLFAVIGVAVMAVRFLRQLADEQALARVSQAAHSARSTVDHSGRMVSISARLLAERPTLLHLIQAGEPEALATFLGQFRQTSRLDGCAVLQAGQVLAQSGSGLDWGTVWAAQTQEADYFFYVPAEGGPPLLGARAAIPALPDTAVMVMMRLDEAFARELGNEIDLPVAIVAPDGLPSPDPLLALRAQALSTQEVAAAWLDNPARYVAVLPLLSPAGQVGGTIETELSAVAISQSLSQLVETLLWGALGVALLAALASFFAGRRLSLPLQTLIGAAARIGHGDLTTPIPPVSGGEIGTLGTTLEDMRRRLFKLTANLRRQQTESDAIVTGIIEGVFTVDRERRLQYLNPQAAAMLGLTAEAAIGRFCGEVLNPQGENGVRPCEERCPIIHARFQAGTRATEHLYLPGGRRRTVVITSAPPTDDPAAREETRAGAPGAGFRQVQVMRDETEEEATRRTRDAVLANISHEFRTPLSAQLASIELLLDQLPSLTTDQIADLVVSLQRGTLRLTQLIDNLLESVRIEAGQFSIRHRPVAIDEVLEQALEMTRPLIDQRQQDLSVELPYPLPPIAGDASRLTQVFVNLLANANKFSLPGSAIRIGGSVSPESVTIWIDDQGPGLTDTDGSVFAPFLRASAEEPEARGVGLGLWIVKSIVERHAGRVDAQSSPAGTRISVTLPRKQTDEDPGR